MITMAHRINPDQIQGARGMLNWSMMDLAVASKVSVSTIKRIEEGRTSHASDSIDLIQNALSAVGVVFLDDNGDGPGLRLRQGVRKDVPHRLPQSPAA